MVRHDQVFGILPAKRRALRSGKTNPLVGRSEQAHCLLVMPGWKWRLGWPMLSKMPRLPAGYPLSNDG